MSRARDEAAGGHFKSNLNIENLKQHTVTLLANRLISNGSKTCKHLRSWFELLGGLVR